MHGWIIGAGWLAVFAAAPAAAQEAPSPKVTVVVSGDPDTPLRERAARLQGLLEGSDDLRTPQDSGLVQALRGEEPRIEDDGLERARAERRRLGWSEARDVPVLHRIGRMTGANLMLVVREGNDGPEVVAFDVAAKAFYEGALSLPSPDGAVGAFVRSRADATRSRRGTEPDAEAEPEASGPSVAPTADEAKPAEESAEDDSEKTWIARYWPYLVGGALLAATVTYFLLRDDDPAPAPPVLRFRIGGDQ
ncbi:MAG: hypothetical protein ACOCV4_00630 [Myxococcota bacterium]